MFATSKLFLRKLHRLQNSERLFEIKRKKNMNVRMVIFSKTKLSQTTKIIEKTQVTAQKLKNVKRKLNASGRWVPAIVFEHVDQLDYCFAFFVLLSRLECVLVFPAEHRVAALKLQSSQFCSKNKCTFYKKHQPRDGVQLEEHALQLVQTRRWQLRRTNMLDPATLKEFNLCTKMAK